MNLTSREPSPFAEKAGQKSQTGPFDSNTDTHSDIGLQLTQFPGKMAMEPKGERVGALEGALTKELFT